MKPAEHVQADNKTHAMTPFVSGDPTRIAVSGDSAGKKAILMSLTQYADNSTKLFTRRNHRSNSAHDGYRSKRPSNLPSSTTYELMYLSVNIHFLVV